MIVKSIEQVPAEPVEMAGVSGVTMRLLLGRADGAEHFAVRQFTVQPGGHTPLHEHNYEHEVLVQSGSGQVQLEQEVCDIRAGSVLLVPAGQTHQFRNTGGQPLVFLCIVPVSFDCCGQQQPVPGS